MRYYKKKHKEFGIKYGGAVETPVLKFLYNRRGENRLFYVRTISRAVRIETDSVRGALNRLWEKRYVKKFKKGKYTLWRIKRNRNVYRLVEQRIGILKKPKPKHIDRKPIPNKSDHVDKISKAAVKLRPLKTALQLAFPKAALPMEVGYRVLANLSTIRNTYSIYGGASYYELRNALNETVQDSTKSTVTYLARSGIQHVNEEAVSTIVGYTSEYLEKKDVFKDLTEALKMDESYSESFKDFYQITLKNYLNQKLLETESEEVSYGYKL